MHSAVISSVYNLRRPSTSWHNWDEHLRCKEGRVLVRPPIFCNLLTSTTSTVLLRRPKRHFWKRCRKAGYYRYSYSQLPAIPNNGNTNPVEQEGTYPLPEAQLDRFMFKMSVDIQTALRGRNPRTTYCSKEGRCRSRDNHWPRPCSCAQTAIEDVLRSCSSYVHGWDCIPNPEDPRVLVGFPHVVLKHFWRLVDLLQQCAVVTLLPLMMLSR